MLTKHYWEEGASYWHWDSAGPKWKHEVDPEGKSTWFKGWFFDQEDASDAAVVNSVLYSV